MPLHVLSPFLFGFLVVTSSVFAGPSPPPGATPLNIANAEFDDPFSQVNDVLLQIDVPTNCPQAILVTVTIVANGVTQPQFTLAPGHPAIDQDFGGDPLYGPPVNSAVPGAHIQFLENFPSPGTTEFIFSSIQSYKPALDANLNPEFDPTSGLPIWRFVVEIPTQAFVDAGLQVVGGDQKIVLKNTDQNAFSAFQLTSEQCGRQGPHGDPVFAGFQGQEFQFHGLPDEHFNLVSSPDVQLNSHFVYVSSGKCDYNDTECFTHPGTYMDVLGFQIAEAKIKIVAGTHEAGLRVWFHGKELTRGTFIRQLSTNVTSASLKYHKNGHVTISTDIMGFEVVNSDMFMNIRTTLNNPQLLRIGATKHTVTDSNICKTNGETHNYQLVESTVAAKYPVTTPLHGLMGQTWRNVKVCGRDWMGTVQDYLVSDLFANDNHYNYFKW